MSWVFQSEEVINTLPALRWAFSTDFRTALRLNRNNRKAAGSSIKTAEATATLWSQPVFEVMTSNQESMIKKVPEIIAPGIATWRRFHNAQLVVNKVKVMPQSNPTHAISQWFARYELGRAPIRYIIHPISIKEAKISKRLWIRNGFL